MQSELRGAPRAGFRFLAGLLAAPARSAEPSLLERMGGAAVKGDVVEAVLPTTSLSPSPIRVVPEPQGTRPHDSCGRDSRARATRSIPKSSSAANALWARQYSVTFSGRCSPPRANGCL